MVANIANQGMLSPVLEKQGILGSAPGRRPGDVTIQNWCDGKGLAIDVAVTSPFSAQHPANKPQKMSVSNSSQLVTNWSG